VTFAAGNVPLMHVKTNLDDKGSLQNGARLYVNYCLGCHSLAFMRYKRMGNDIGLTVEQIRENLLFASDKVVDSMDIAMRAEAAGNWFGVAPPDLSVISRFRGADWLYSYLVTFYQDPNPARPFGVNNIVFTDVGMPHVLWELQGIQSRINDDRPEGIVAEHVEAIEPSAKGYKLHTALVHEDGNTSHVVDRLEVARAGSMQPAEFRKAARDLVNFLVYVGEPAQLVRYQIGFWVLLFIAIFFILSRALYKEYWKDVH
jgi:ubiquinol-cytochrome c reductase cytochrome c1 subunit